MDTNHIIITSANLKDKASNQQKLRNQLPAPFHFNGTLQPVKALLSGCIGLPRIKKKKNGYLCQPGFEVFLDILLGPHFLFLCSILRL
jgi:hypothetical protein